MPSPRVVVSCVERGWQAARQWSLDATENVRVIHIIKGWLPADVRSLIAPRAGVSLISVPRAAFWPCVLACAAWARAARRLDGILVDHDRSAARLRRWAAMAGVPVLRIAEGEAAPCAAMEPCASR